jgi:hypothetical protein
MNDTINYILILLIFSCVIYAFINYDELYLTCIKSNKSNKTYCVRDNKNKGDVVDLFSNVSLRIDKLINYIIKEKKNKDNFKRLVTKYRHEKIYEILPTSTHTAYSENKGEKIALCSTKEKNGMKLIDINTLMFVVLHELAHVMTVSIGHTDEFWDNFKQLLIVSEKINIYNPENYDETPVKYCGSFITDNPFY